MTSAAPRSDPLAAARAEAAQLVQADTRRKLATYAARERRESALFAREALRGHGPCFGAAALAMPASLCALARRNPVQPRLARAPSDKSDAYPSVSGEPTCFSYAPWFPEVVCHRGSRTARIRVALVGNSHAGQWLPALEVIGRRRGWQITTFLASNCAVSATPQNFRSAPVSSACNQWVNTTAALVAHGRFDLVVLSNKVSMTAVGHDLGTSYGPYERGYVAVLRRWQRAGLAVVALRDTPSPWPEDVPACLAAQARGDCVGRRRAWLRPDPVVAAVRDVQSRRISAADLSSYFCSATVCPPVIGGVVVYFDGSHVTATYDRTLADPLGSILQPALRRG